MIPRQTEPERQSTARRFKDMSNDELVGFCRRLYSEQGIGGLSYEVLKTYRTLYTTLYLRGLKQSALLERLGLVEEYRAWKSKREIRYGGQIRERWSWERVVREARQAQEAQGFLPPAAWWQANGGASLVQAIYQMGRTWEDLRAALGDFHSSKFVESRSGLRWRSHAEASLSNFLYARGIPHSRGSRYPKEYEDLTGRAYGMYDMHFEGRLGPVDVEVWGDKPNGSDGAAYQVKREGKELFNADNPGFLGIHFADCYSDDRLAEILERHLGVIVPFRFDRPTDRVIPSTHWSNADELLDYCRTLAVAQPNGEFPTEEWLRKRGKWVNRPGPAYNTLSVYIKIWLGGVRPLRQLLGQSHVSTMKWDREAVLARWKAFRELHRMTPNAMRARASRGQGRCSPEVLRAAGVLASAVAKYAGGSAAADEATGFKPYRKKPSAVGAIGLVRARVQPQSRDGARTLTDCSGNEPKNVRIEETAASKCPCVSFVGSAL